MQRQWLFGKDGLECLWSPTPIYAYKFYTYAPRHHGVRSMFGDVYYPNIEYERSCAFTRWIDDIDDPTRSCEGEWPNVVHTKTFGDGGRVMDFGGPTCGFYSYKLDHHASGKYVWYEETNKVIALVELSGIVVEHEYGYRSERQKVIDWKGLPVRTLGFEDSFNEVIETYRLMWKEKYYG